MSCLGFCLQGRYTLLIFGTMTPKGCFRGSQQVCGPWKKPRRSKFLVRSATGSINVFNIRTLTCPSDLQGPRLVCETSRLRKS
ncbi:hypothetical protein GOODEAATRI_011238 [Goodea atripinnis]|uniref:Secreted protein n=1 Tax=Goodea atripinnis TaxID=208336 RepID=A0ABV0N9Q9_9TELE